MSALAKLPGVLPSLVGKTIERTMLVFHPDGRFQLWLFFSDGTYYEFYGSNDLSGALRAMRCAPRAVRRALCVMRYASGWVKCPEWALMDSVTPVKTGVARE
jgi:hypothetical protein